MQREHCKKRDYWNKGPFEIPFYEEIIYQSFSKTVFGFDIHVADRLSRCRIFNTFGFYNNK